MSAQESPVASFRDALAMDLFGLARLCVLELDRDTVDALIASDFPSGLGLALDDADGERALTLMARAVAALPAAADRPGMDELAADFGAIFLTNGYEAPASESPWLDEEKLERQQASADVAAWYAHHGYAPHDPLRRPADFIAFELGFLAHLMSREGDDDAILAEAARFLDVHALAWIPDFCRRIAERCGTPFYAAWAAVTAAYLARLRTALRDLGCPEVAPFSPVARPASGRPCD